MRFRFLKKFHELNCSFHVIILAFFWTAGLLFGIAIGRGAGPYLSLMRMIPRVHMSIVGLIEAAFLPILVVVAVAFSKSLALRYICIFFRSLFSGLLLFGLANAYGSAAWLIRIFLVSDWAVSFVSIWLCSLVPASDPEDKRRTVIIGALIAVAAGVMDYLLISPFLVNIML